VDITWLFIDSRKKMVFAKLIFFPPNFFAQKDFPIPKYQKKSFGGKKINLAKKVDSIPNRPCSFAK
jgi:hypothetical protein